MAVAQNHRPQNWWLETTWPNLCPNFEPPIWRILAPSIQASLWQRRGCKNPSLSLDHCCKNENTWALKLPKRESNKTMDSLNEMLQGFTIPLDHFSRAGHWWEPSMIRLQPLALWAECRPWWIYVVGQLQGGDTKLERKIFDEHIENMLTTLKLHCHKDDFFVLLGGCTKTHNLVSALEDSLMPLEALRPWGATEVEVLDS